MSMDNDKNTVPTATEIARKAAKASTYISGIDYGGYQQHLYDYAMAERAFSADNKGFIDARKKLEETLPKEEWIWVTGYKGTDRDMKCKNDYQFEVGKKFDMPEDTEIRQCSSGFHFCTKLEDVFDYYAIGCGTRFFEVSALVRTSDYTDACIKPAFKDVWTYVSSRGYGRDSKLAAKSIIFTRELTADEVLKHTRVDCSGWTEEEKRLAMEKNPSHVLDARRAKQLVELGYSEAFAKWIVTRGYFDSAYAVGQQKDLSMDMKVAAILG